jgi:hypothetical protein
VTATRRGCKKLSNTIQLKAESRLTHLSNCNTFSTRAPSCFFEELGELCSLSTACLAHYHRDLVRFNGVEKAFLVPGDRQQGCWGVQGWDKGQVKVGHCVCRPRIVGSLLMVAETLSLSLIRGGHCRLVRRS